MATLRVLHEVGRGTFAKVFLASRAAGGRVEEVVVKTLRDVDRATLHREFSILQACAHENIVRPLGFVEEVCASTPGKVYGPGIIFSPALSDLARHMEQHGKPCETAAEQWARELAEALARVHAACVIHRDVKPSNALLYLDASEVCAGAFMKITLRLADFGSARYLPRRGSGVRRRCGSKTPFDDLGRSLRGAAYPMTARVCTAWYRGPELLREEDSDREEEDIMQYGLSLDVWSFGTVFFELLFGKPLARSDCLEGLLACLLQALGGDFADGEHKQVPRYTEQSSWGVLVQRASALPRRRPLLKEMGGGLWDVVRACLRWDPRARPAMAQVLRLLPSAAHATPLGGGRGAQSPERAEEAASGGGQQTAFCELFRPGPPSEKLLQEGKSDLACACAGHCRLWSHARAGECKSTSLVEGGRHCRLCVCVVPGCVRPKLRSDFCYMHRRVLAELPPPARLAVQMAPIAHALVPSDVYDFVDIFRECSDDVGFTIIMAQIKESLATAVFRQGWRTLPPEYLASAFLSIWHDVIDAAACASTPCGDRQPPHKVALEQLSRQGASRFQGLAMASQQMGVLRKAGEGDDEGATRKLGLTGHAYCKTGETEMLAKFFAVARGPKAAALKKCYAAAGSETDKTQLLDHVFACASALRALLDSMQGAGALCPAIRWPPTDGIVRKHAVALIGLLGPGDIDWQRCSSTRLQEISPDFHKHLQCLPASWNAAEISCFICGREDWPFLASMYMCQWKEVADKVEEAERRCLDARPRFLEVAREFRLRHGFDPHPYTLVCLAGVAGENAATAERSAVRRRPSAASTGRRAIAVRAQTA